MRTRGPSPGGSAAGGRWLAGSRGWRGPGTGCAPVPGVAPGGPSRRRAGRRPAASVGGGSRPALLDLVLEAPVGADAGGDRADLQPLAHAPEPACGDLRQQGAGEDVVDVEGEIGRANV